jgi:hypothetical protein
MSKEHCIAITDSMDDWLSRSNISSYDFALREKQDILSKPQIIRNILHLLQMVHPEGLSKDWYLDQWFVGTSAERQAEIEAEKKRIAEEEQRWIDETKNVTRFREG